MALNRGTVNEDAFFDAQGQNKSARNAKLYSDLDLFFGQNNTDGDVNQTYDAQAVKRSIRNLVLTNQYEKPFHPEIYSGVRGMLFELMTPTTAVIIARHVEDVIVNYEPRARLVGVRAYPDLDRNEYEISIEFYIVNAPTELVTLELVLERVR
jgi:phage baseplate assembly protein W